MYSCKRGVIISHPEGILVPPSPWQQLMHVPEEATEADLRSGVFFWLITLQPGILSSPALTHLHPFSFVSIFHFIFLLHFCISPLFLHFFRGWTQPTDYSLRITDQLSHTPFPCAALIILFAGGGGQTQVVALGPGGGCVGSMSMKLLRWGGWATLICFFSVKLLNFLMS